MVPSIPRRSGIRNRTLPHIHRNSYEIEFQGAQVTSKSTVPLNPHATPGRFSIPTPKQQDITPTHYPHILLSYYQRKGTKSKEKGTKPKEYIKI